MEVVTTKNNIRRKAELTVKILIKCATHGETITYKELSERLNAEKLNSRLLISNSNPRSLGSLLGYIRDEICQKNGLPMLNIIVVRGKPSKTSKLRLPGDRAFSSRVLSEIELKKMYEEEKKRVFAFTEWEKYTCAAMMI